MIFWLDAQLSPALAPWLAKQFDVESHAIRDLGLRDAKDKDIFFAARAANAVVMTKDSDFLVLLDAHGPPPSIVWITCGNTSNTHLKELLTIHFHKTLKLLEQKEILVELSDVLGS